jgi:hypothetical protein
MTKRSGASFDITMPTAGTAQWEQITYARAAPHAVTLNAQRTTA